MKWQRFSTSFDNQFKQIKILKCLFPYNSIRLTIDNDLFRDSEYKVFLFQSIFFNWLRFVIWIILWQFIDSIWINVNKLYMKMKSTICAWHGFDVFGNVLVLWNNNGKQFQIIYRNFQAKQVNEFHEMK